MVCNSAREGSKLKLKDSLGLWEGEAEAWLVGKLHLCVPERPQEGPIYPFLLADRVEEGSALLLGGVEVGKSLKTEQGEPPQAEPPFWIYGDVQAGTRGCSHQCWK